MVAPASGTAARLALLVATVVASAVAVASCRSSSSREAPPAASARTASADAAAPVTASSDTRAAASPLLPPVDLGKPGPIVVVGYPAPFNVGQGDPLGDFGYTRDGSFARCAIDACCAAHSSCTIVGRDGAMRILDDTSNDMAHDAVKKAEILRLVADEHLSKPTATGEAGQLRGPPLVGSWPYARDLVLHVAGVPGDPGEAPSFRTRVPVIRIGGAVGKEAPVFVESLPITACDKPGTWTCVDAGINGMVLSPDGGELAVVAYSPAGAHVGLTAFTRISTSTLAARIYNDTGLRHHEAGRYAEAAKDFASAAAADAEHPFAAYNLACADARLASPGTESALRVAIAHARDPAAVKARAAKDQDLATVRNAPWFVALVGPSP